MTMNFRRMLEIFRDRMRLGDVEDFPENEAIKLANEAGEQILNENPFLVERKYSAAAVANQQSYDLPEDFYDMFFVKMDDFTMYGKSDRLSQELINAGYFSDDERWNVWNGKLHLHDVPSSSAQTTTLVGDITASDDSIIVVEPSDGLPEMGTVQIGDEKIWYEYGYKSGSNVVLTRLTRGAEDTVAAAHSNGDTVSHLNIEMNYFAKFREAMIVPETGKLEAASGGSNLAAGRHYVMWTYYDANKGRESYPKDLYSITTSSGEKISASSLNDDPMLDGWKKRVYVTKADRKGPYYLAATLDYGTESVDIDVSDATLGGYDEFDWDSIGGDNLVSELRMVQVFMMMMIYLERSKRYNEAVAVERRYLAQLDKVSQVLVNRREISVRGMNPDIYW